MVMQPSLNVRKRIALSSFLMLLMTAICFLILPIAFAEDAATTTNPIAGVIQSLVNNIFETLYDIKDGIGLSSYADIMLGRNSGFLNAVTGETGIGTTIMNSIKVIAAGVLMIYLVMDVIRMAERGTDDIDVILIPMIKLTIAALCIFYVDTIVNALESAGYNIVEYLEKELEPAMVDAIEGPINDMKKAMAEIGKSAGDAAAANAAEEESLTEILEEDGFGAFLTTGLSRLVGIDDVKNILMEFWQGIPTILLLSVFLNPICMLLMWTIKLQSYSLFFELAIRKAFMPIALCGIVEGRGGMASPGVRYLKKYIGVYFKMGILLIAVALSYTIPVASTYDWAADAAKDPTGFSLPPLFRIVGSSIACRGAALSVFKESSRYVDEILAVR